MRFLALLVVLLFASAAGGEDLTIGWTAATGPVADYMLESSTNGEPFTALTLTGGETQITHPFVDGDVEQFRVFAMDADGRAGPRSLASIPYVVGEDRGPVVITAPGRPVVVLPSP